MDVEFVEELGGTQLLHGRIEGRPFVLQAATGTVPTEGKLTLSIEADKLHLFDPQTGRRLG